MFSKSLMMMVLISLVALPALASAEASQSGSTDVNFSNTLFIGGNEIKPGQYRIEWLSNSPEATVIFKSKASVAAKVQGRIEKLAKKIDFDTTVTAKDSNGREVLRSILLEKKQIQIIFD